MRLRHTFLPLCLVAAMSACSARQDENSCAGPVQEPAPVPSASVANPITSFERLVGGEWRMTAQSGTSMFDTWHWGPGRHSVREVTDGLGAGGEPWRELRVYYWHPGRKQVCMLGLSPYAAGVSQGTIKFEGESAEGFFDLFQTRGRRNMAQRWTFEGPDKYHSVLLESSGSGGFAPLVEFDHFRSRTPVPRPRQVEDEPKPSGSLKIFESILGHSWEARGAWADGGTLHIQTAFEWMPYCNGIYARVSAPTNGGEPAHLLDAYIYHHTGTDRLRCLALSNLGERGGGVYEGDVAVLDGGAVQFDLTGHEGERVVHFVLRFDFEKDGTVRDRVWSLDGAPPERTLMLDVHHRKVIRE